MQGVPRAQLANADLAPTPSERSPLFHGRRPVQLGRTMRRETSQAGNRARKTCRRFRRGEHAGELEAGPPEVLRARDRHTLLNLRYTSLLRGASPRKFHWMPHVCVIRSCCRAVLGQEAVPGLNPATPSLLTSCPIELPTIRQLAQHGRQELHCWHGDQRQKTGVEPDIDQDQHAVAQRRL